MRKPLILASCCSLFALSGCGHSVAPPAISKPTAQKLAPPIVPGANVVPTTKVVAPTRLTWTKDMIPGGFMFRSEEEFLAYLEESEVAVIGTLTSMHRGNGKLRVERVLRGQADAEIDLRSDGGFLFAKPGERVIALLSTRDGRMVLHAHCAASGLYGSTKPLAEYVERALQFRPL